MFGVPVSAPVVVLKLIPGGVALIAKLAIAPPVELMVKPVAAVLTVRVSVDDERVNAGAAIGIDNLVIFLEAVFAVYKEPTESTVIPKGVVPVVPIIDEAPVGVIFVTLLEPEFAV